MKSRPMLKNIINETDPELFKKKKLISQIQKTDGQGEREWKEIGEGVKR